jgi:hypothetical protein
MVVLLFAGYQVVFADEDTRTVLVWERVVYKTTGLFGDHDATKMAYSATKFNWSAVQTIGDHSYIPLGIPEANPGDHAFLILSVLDTFERVHPEWKVESWVIEKQQRAHITHPCVDGIWVNHRDMPRSVILGPAR